MGQRKGKQPKRVRPAAAGERDRASREAAARADRSPAAREGRPPLQRAEALAAERPSAGRLDALERSAGRSARTRQSGRAQAMAAGTGAERGPSVAQRRAGAGSDVAQRVLAHDQPIDADEVKTVVRRGSKLVFELTGEDGDKVIVKLETFGGSETTEVAESRNEMIQALAEQILPNVPQMRKLSPADVRELQNLPDALGEDAKTLKAILGDARAVERMLLLKKEHVSVGENLQAMIEKEREAALKPVKVKEKGGRGGLRGLFGGGGGRQEEQREEAPREQPLAASWKLLLNPGIIGSMGRTAAFDLLVGSTDRFVPDPDEVNLENIDFSAAGAELFNLDQFDPNAPITEDREWEGGKVLTEGGAIRKYAESVYQELFTAAGVPDRFFHPDLVAAFHQGMLDGVAALKAQKTQMEFFASRRAGTSDVQRTMAGVVLKRLRALP